MSENSGAVAADAKITAARWPRTVIGRFFGKRAVRSAGVWGLVFGAYAAAQSTGFVKLYNTAAARTQLASTLGNNAGLKALLGDTRHINTVGGFVAWRTLGIAVIVGAVWGLLFATKSLRGEETSGRMELFLAGQTTARRATLNVLSAFAAGIAIMYALTALITTAVGRTHNVDFTAGQSLFFALAVVVPAAEFLAVGAFVSQLMPIRNRAATVGSGVFGVAFVLRAMADSASSMHWLNYVSPLGWVESLHPLTGASPVWLLPIVLFVGLLAAGAVWLAGRRDLGDSMFADKDTARPHTALLGSPLWLSVRLMRASAIGWLLAVTVLDFMFGTVTKNAGQAFNSTKAVRRVSEQLTRQSQVAGSRAYVGIVLFMVMTLAMAQVAGAVGNMRETEAEGYLDNLLVRPVGRLRWLTGRVVLAAALAVLLSTLGGLAVWFGAATQHAGLSLHDTLLAGLNAAAPAILLLGIGVFVFCFAPRITSFVTYGMIAWSFLVELLGSVINLNHWVSDTSLLHHITLAPAVSANWQTVYAYAAVGLGLILLGMWRFVSRDLANE